jgi:hypothetical protein
MLIQIIITTMPETQAVVWRSYEIKETLNAVSQIDALFTAGLSWHLACENFGIKYLYYHLWKILLKKIDGIMKVMSLCRKI